MGTLLDETHVAQRIARMRVRVSQLIRCLDAERIRTASKRKRRPGRAVVQNVSVGCERPDERRQVNAGNHRLERPTR